MTPEPGGPESSRTGPPDTPGSLLSVGLVSGVAIGTLIGYAGAGIALVMSVGVIAGWILIRRLTRTPARDPLGCHQATSRPMPLDGDGRHAETRAA